MRSDLRTHKVYSFRGGLDVKTSPLELANTPKLQSRVTLANNIVYPVTGGASKRLDRTVITTVSLGASVQITGGIQLRLSSGTNRVIVGTNDGRLVRVDTDGTTTNLATGLTAGTRWAFCQYNDLAIACNGADPPRKSDGTAAGTAALGGTPPATGTVPAAHGNRVFMLDATQRSRLSWCALNNEENWTAAGDAGSILVSANDGTNAVGLVPSIGELVTLKGRRPYRLQGTSPATFALPNLVPAAGSIGAISQAACFFALNDVWWLSTAGVHTLATTQKFGDLTEAFISEEIDPYFRPATALQVSLHRLNLAAAVYDQQNNRVLVAVDTNDDQQNDLFLVYDTALSAWSVWPSFIGTAAMWPVYNATNGLTEIWTGGYDGHVRVLNRDVATNAIDGHMRHVSNFNTPGIEKSPRHLFVYTTEEGNITLTVTVNYDFGLSGGQTYSISMLGNSHTLGVNWTLGVDPLGAQAQIVKRLNVSGTGEYIETGFRNQNAGQSFTVLGYEYLWRPRRLVRRAS